MLLLACADLHQPFSRLSYFNIFEFALLKQLKICSGIPRPVSERDFHHPLEEEKKQGPFSILRQSIHILGRLMLL